MQFVCEFASLCWCACTPGHGSGRLRLCAFSCGWCVLTDDGFTGTEQQYNWTGCTLLLHRAGASVTSIFHSIQLGPTHKTPTKLRWKVAQDPHPRRQQALPRLVIRWRHMKVLAHAVYQAVNSCCPARGGCQAAPPQNKCDMDIFVFSQTRDPDLSVEVFLWIPIHLFDSRNYFAGSRKASTTKNHWQNARMRSCWNKHVIGGLQ